MKTEILLKETETLADFIMIHCVGKSRILARYINLTDNKHFGNALVSDLGDYVPFFYWLGKLTENPAYIDWAENQIIMTVEKAQMPCGLFAFSSHNSPLIVPITLFLSTVIKKKLCLFVI